MKLMNIQKFAPLAVALMTVFAANAQDNLTKEIVVEKNYVPEEQKADKINEAPQLLKIRAEQSDLQYSTRSIAVDAGGEVRTMAPYGYKTKYDFGINRGYVDFSAGSFLNMRGDAGFRIVDNDATKLNLWLKHESSWGMHNDVFKRGSNAALSGIKDSFEQKFANEVAGVNFSQEFGLNTFSLDAFYHFVRQNYNMFTADKGIAEQFCNINEANVTAGFAGCTYDEDFRYNVDFSFNWFGSDFRGKEAFNDINFNEKDFRLYGGIAKDMAGASTVALDFDGELLMHKGLVYNPEVATAYVGSKKTLGKIRLVPRYEYRRNGITFGAGVNVDISFNDGTKFRFSPDVFINAAISRGFSVDLSVRGGKEFNTFSRMFAYNRLVNTAQILGGSYTPMDARIGINLGAFGGFKLNLFGGYGIFDDAVLPVARFVYPLEGGSGFEQIPYGLPGIICRNDDLKGAYAGAAISWEYGKLIKISADGKYSPQDEDSGYSFGLDRPEYVVNAKLSVNPVKNLGITVGYGLRGNRGVWYNETVTEPVPGKPGVLKEKKIWRVARLADAHNLYAGATYRFNKHLGLTIEFNNILNKDWESAQWYMAQGFSVMGGFSLKF